METGQSSTENNTVSLCKIPHSIPNGARLRILRSASDERPDITFETLLARQSVRDKIFHLAFGDNFNPCRRTICNFRVVSKTCLKWTHKYIRKKRWPLHHFSLGQSKSQDLLSDTTHGIHFVENYLFLQNKFAALYVVRPTYSLELWPDFFHESNYQTLYNCLMDHGSELVRLSINVPCNYGSLCCVLPKLELPILNNFEFSTTEQCTNFYVDEKATNNLNFIFLIQSVLNGAMSLREISFSVKNSILFSSLKYLILPETIKFFKCSNMSSTEGLQIFERKKLHNLEYVEIHLPIVCSTTFHKKLAKALSMFGEGVKVLIVRDLLKDY